MGTVSIVSKKNVPTVMQLLRYLPVSFSLLVSASLNYTLVISNAYFRLRILTSRAAGGDNGGRRLNELWALLRGWAGSAMSCEGDIPTFTEDINAYYSINFPNLRQGTFQKAD